MPIGFKKKTQSVQLKHLLGLSLEDHPMHKILLIAFLLFFSSLAQSRPSFGENCKNSDLNKPLLTEHSFPKIRCWAGICNEDWEGYGIPDHDDNLEDKGWTPKQVSLVIHTLNIDNKFNNADDEKREEDLYKKILDELEEVSPFSDVTGFWNFIQSLSPQIQTKINIQTQTALTERFQEICQPQVEPVENPPQSDQEETLPQCCKFVNLEQPHDCSNPISEETERRAWPIEVEIDMCNPAVCCEKNSTEEKTPRYGITKQDCKAHERKATLKEDEEGKCNIGNPTACCEENNTIVYREDSCEPPLRPATTEETSENSCNPSESEENENNDSTTEAGSSCSSGECVLDSSSPTTPSTAEQAEELAQLLEESRKELEETRRKHREEIESLEDQREERDREYGEKREERDKDNTALAADLSDCQSRSGNWSELSEANQKICGLLTRIHQRQDEIAKMQDYNQQVQQQLWQAVQSQSMNAFSQYESIHKMMRPGFFNSPYPGQNLQMMDQINSMKASISSLQNSMDQQTLTSKFDQLVSRMDQMIQLNATGVYNSDGYYRSFRQDLLGVQQAIPNQQNKRPVLR